MCTLIGNESIAFSGSLRAVYPFLPISKNFQDKSCGALEAKMFQQHLELKGSTDYHVGQSL
jgi:hypothetical protein